MITNLLLILIVTLVLTAFAVACFKLGYQEGMSKGLDLMAHQMKLNTDAVVSAMEDRDGTGIAQKL